MTTPNNSNDVDRLNRQLTTGAAASAQYNENLFRMQTGLRGIAVPGLAAVGILGLFSGAAGGAGGAVDSLTEGQARWEESLFRIGNLIQRGINPFLQEMGEGLGVVADAVEDADRATDGLSTQLGLLAAGIYLTNRLTRGGLVRAARSPVAPPVAAVAGAGTALAASGALGQGSTGASAGIRYLAVPLAEEIIRRLPGLDLANQHGFATAPPWLADVLNAPRAGQTPYSPSPPTGAAEVPAPLPFREPLLPTGPVPAPSVTYGDVNITVQTLTDAEAVAELMRQVNGLGLASPHAVP